MYIIKPTPEMKRHVPLLLMGGMMCCLSAVTYAHEEHNHMTDEQPVMQMDASSAMQHQQHQSVPVRAELDHTPHNHHREHGGQMYQATTLENAWTVDDHGRGSASSKLKTWIGTDENKIFIKAHVEKAE